MARGRRRYSEDRDFQEQWEASLKVSSYADKVLEAMQSGSDVPEGIVPDFSDPSSGISSENESSSLFSMDPRRNDYMFQTAAAAIGLQKIENATDAKPMQKTAQTQTQTQAAPNRPQLKLSQNQLRALKKFPALVEFLGGENGDQIAKTILSQVNRLVVKKIEANTKAVHKSAHACEVAGQNIKTYFVGNDGNGQWVCCVIASGPFRGDEAIFYKAAEDKAYVIRKRGDDWANVTGDFNVVHEFAREGD
jgi:hypothetical protein